MGFYNNVNHDIHRRDDNYVRTKTFFIDIPEKKQKDIQIHRNDIKGIYENWQKINFNRNSYTLGIDLNTFHPDYQKLQIIEQLISTYGQSNNKRQTKDEMSLSAKFQLVLL